MSINAYINFNGNCREAVEFYAKVFDVDKQEIMAYGDVPADEGFPITEETKNLVMHTYLEIEGDIIMFSDIPPDMPFVAGNNVGIVVNIKAIDKLKLVFDRLKADGRVEMELQETFWSKCYGAVIDRFGISWQLNHDDECAMTTP